MRIVGPGLTAVAALAVLVDRPASIESGGGGRLNCCGSGGAPTCCRVSVVSNVAVGVGVGPGCGAAGTASSCLFPVSLIVPVGATGRAPGCGAGGDEEDCVVVAGT